MADAGWSARARSSLRTRVLLVITFVVLAPLAFVWATDLADATVEQRMRVTLTLAAQRAGHFLGAREPEHLDRVARRHAVWLRVVDARGDVVIDVDQERGTILARLAGVLFREDGAPTLEAWDATQPPVGARAGVIAARSVSQSGCERSPEGTLLVCWEARPVDLPDGTGVIYVQQSTRRAIRALYDARYQLLKMTLANLLLAGLLGVWLGLRIVGPIEILRSRVLARVDRPVTAAPIGMTRADEIGDLARAFDTLLAAVTDRSRKNEAFVADLAHEMKNPVAAIRAVAESLDGDDPRAQRLSRVLSDSSHRLDTLVTELLELARAEAGLAGEIREPVRLDLLVHGIVDVARANPRHAAVQFEVDAAEVTVDGIPGRLEAAIRNLVANAAVYAAKGGGHVRVRVVPEGTVVVADDGPGIAPDDLPHVFERFFSRRQGGTGLGLALVRAVAEAHGGSVGVTSNGGATFTLTVT